MPSTRTLFLLSLAVLMGCATEKSAAEKPAAVNPPAIKNFGLTTTDEVPTCPAAGQVAQGTANVTLAPDDSSLTATVNYSGLSGPATAAHIHAGKPESPGRWSFRSAVTSPLRSTRPSPPRITSPPPMLRPDFPSFVQSLKSGGAYLNVHSAACKPRRSAGQIP